MNQHSLAGLVTLIQPHTSSKTGRFFDVAHLVSGINFRFLSDTNLVEVLVVISRIVVDYCRRPPIKANSTVQRVTVVRQVGCVPSVRPSVLPSYDAIRDAILTCARKPT